ncbi:hypothetical protein [Reyranella sp.]|uniref:hypothetical protein n=1 Tax=Reyranella sp. TaxID=1929291 RepID=UPI00260429F5|nr:hypothetical protein [Reyranella sp.]HQS16581.1 hypothetical protein [Reyranella sp.]HQT13319.1 hypothetical protein [Reyranella sp.]
MSLPWETAGPGYSGDALVRGPSCADAVVLFVARRPGGEPKFDEAPDKVLPGNAPIALEITPVASVPALARAGDGTAMTKALPAALGAWLRAQAMPQKLTNRAALIAAGPTTGDCSVSDTLPWTAAGRGYHIDAFSDGTDCINAATALVIRAPDGRPLYSAATPGFIVEIYHSALRTRADMKKALAGIETMTEDTTGKLPEWPDGLAEREITQGDFTTTVAESFDRTSWNALREAQRPMLAVDPGIESVSLVVLMPDGRVVEVGRSRQN